MQPEFSIVSLFFVTAGAIPFLLEVPMFRCFHHRRSGVWLLCCFSADRISFYLLLVVEISSVHLSVKKTARNTSVTKSSDKPKHM